MSPSAVIFLSAVSRELKSARQLVANTLAMLGYEADWQDIFGAEQGDLKEMLRRRIDASAGVVQLVGHCYGAEPPEPDPKHGRVSYTQYEALYAHEQGKRVWYLFLEDAFPEDMHSPEPEELRALQAAYRERVRTGGDLYYPLKNIEGLEASVLKLRDDLSHLRRGVKRYAELVLVLLLASVALGGWVITRSHHTEGKLVEVQGKLDQLLNRGVEEYRQTEAALRDEGVQTPTELERRTYEQLAERLGTDPKALKAELPTFAAKMKSDPTAPAFLRASAAYVAKDFIETGRLALAAAGEALAAKPPRRGDAVKAYELAGWAAEQRIRYDDAARQFLEAEKYTDRAANPLEWARVQYARAWVAHGQGLYREAEALLRPVLEERQRLLGPEDPEILVARHYIARELLSQGRAVEAESEYRRLIPLNERVRGPEHPDTLRSRNNLAVALNAQGKHEEAEKEIRAVLAVKERVLGPDDPVTLTSRMNLASNLYGQKRYPEAEREYRMSVADRTRVLGPEHPDTLSSRTGVANTLSVQGKYADAEEQHRQVIAIRERVLGRDHPATLTSRNNLAVTLRAEGKLAEAEKEERGVLAAQERALGTEHPEYVRSEYNLARILELQKRYPEALVFAQKAEQGWMRTLGPEHPDTKSAVARRKQIEKSLRAPTVKPTR